MALLQNLQRNLSQGTGAPKAEAGATEQVRQLAQAASGTAAGPQEGPGMSRVAERRALLQQQQQAAQLQVQGQATAQQIEQAAQQQKQQQQIELAGMQERRLNMRSNMLNQAQNLVAKLEMNRDEISFNRQKAAYEQLGFNLRLSNKDYIEKLQINGAKNRLNDKVAFKEELQRSVFKELEGILRDDLEFKRLLNADERVFREELQNKELDWWLQFETLDANTKNAAAKWEAVSGITSGVIQGTATVMQSRAENPAPPTETKGSNLGSLREYDSGNLK